MTTSTGDNNIIDKNVTGGENNNDDVGTTTNAITEVFRQRLMYAEEVYLYKIPPLRDAGGHRAEDWNLAEPLKTCSLLVERRGDKLVLEFQADNKLFAESIVDCSIPKNSNSNDNDNIPQQKRIQYWLEQVVDSSRYFTLKITGQGGRREATIGFGFRDRDQAIDLRESMQHYDNSMKREYEAAIANNKLQKYTIPKLADNEKIHINTNKDGGGGGGSSSTTIKTITTKSDSGTKKKIPLLLKKPPPSPESAAKQKIVIIQDSVSQQQDLKQPSLNNNNNNNVNEKKLKNMRISMGSIDLDKEYEEAHGTYEEASSGAVFEGDEADWNSEFTS